MLQAIVLASFGLSLGAFVAAPMVSFPVPDCSCFKTVSYTDSGNFVGLSVTENGNDSHGGCLNDDSTPPKCNRIGWHNCSASRAVSFTAPSGIAYDRSTGQSGFTRTNDDGTTSWIGIGENPCSTTGSTTIVELIVVCGSSATNTLSFYNSQGDCQLVTPHTAWVKLHLTCSSCGVLPPN